MYQAAPYLWGSFFWCVPRNQEKLHPSVRGRIGCITQDSQIIED